MRARSGDKLRWQIVLRWLACLSLLGLAHASAIAGKIDARPPAVGASRPSPSPVAYVALVCDAADIAASERGDEAGGDVRWAPSPAVACPPRGVTRSALPARSGVSPALRRGRKVNRGPPFAV